MPDREGMDEAKDNIPVVDADGFGRSHSILSAVDDLLDPVEEFKQLEEGAIPSLQQASPTKNTKREVRVEDKEEGVDAPSQGPSADVEATGADDDDDDDDDGADDVGDLHAKTTKLPTLREWLQDGKFALAMAPGFFGFYAHMGAALALEEAGLIKNVSFAGGASAGALVAGFVASGMNCEVMVDTVLKFRRNDFWDPPGLGGLLRGKLFEKLIEKELPAGVRTFEQCPIPCAVTGYDVSRLCTRIIKTGRLAPALRASCTFPLLFAPVWHPQGVLVDGGVQDRDGLWAVPQDKEDCRRILNISFMSVPEQVISREEASEALDCTTTTATMSNSSSSSSSSNNSSSSRSSRSRSSNSSRSGGGSSSSSSSSGESSRGGASESGGARPQDDANMRLGPSHPPTPRDQQEEDEQKAEETRKCRPYFTSLVPPSKMACRQSTTSAGPHQTPTTTSTTTSTTPPTPPRTTITSLVLTNMPSPHPFAMQRGGLAVAAARRLVTALLDTPLQTGLEEGHFVAMQLPRAVSATVLGEKRKASSSSVVGAVEEEREGGEGSGEEKRAAGEGGRGGAGLLEGRQLTDDASFTTASKRRKTLSD